MTLPPRSCGSDVAAAVGLRVLISLLEHADDAVALEAWRCSSEAARRRSR
jgi:hypothetical protein